MIKESEQSACVLQLLLIWQLQFSKISNSFTKRGYVEQRHWRPTENYDSSDTSCYWKTENMCSYVCFFLQIYVVFLFSLFAGIQSAALFGEPYLGQVQIKKLTLWCVQVPFCPICASRQSPFFTYMWCTWGLRWESEG